MTSRKAKTLDLILQLIKKNYWKEVKTRAEIKDLKNLIKMAEREGFEPSIGVNLYSLSRGALSTTQPSLRAEMQLGEACLRGQAVIG